MRPPTSSEEAGVLVITLDDPNALNDGRSDAFRQALYELVEQRGERPSVAVDLGPVDYLSSSGVAMLVGLKRRVEARQGRLILCQLHPYVADVLRITKLSNFFTIAPDRPAALASLSDGPA